MAARSAGWCSRNFAEVLTQGTAGTLSAAVDLTFAMTGSADEVAGHARAGQADRVGISAVAAAWEDAVVSQAGQMPWVRIAV